MAAKAIRGPQRARRRQPSARAAAAAAQAAPAVVDLTEADGDEEGADPTPKVDVPVQFADMFLATDNTCLPISQRGTCNLVFHSAGLRIHRGSEEEAFVSYTHVNSVRVGFTLAVSAVCAVCCGLGCCLITHPLTPLAPQNAQTNKDFQNLMVGVAASHVEPIFGHNVGKGSPTICVLAC